MDRRKILFSLFCDFFVLVASYDVVTLQGMCITDYIRVALKAGQQANWPAVKMG